MSASIETINQVIEQEKAAVVQPLSEVNQAVETTATANNKNFFQSNKFTLIALTALTVLTGGAFAAFYFGAIAITAVVAAATTIGLDLAFLNSMSVLAASATIAGVGAATVTVVSAATAAISTGISACFSWASNLFNTPVATSVALEEEEEEEEEVVVEEEASSSSAMSLSALGGVNVQPPSIDSPVNSLKTEVKTGAVQIDEDEDEDEDKEPAPLPSL
tara:strand:- start:590 stop:1246 length:657 start_codon:yes stop_codon:yes gene_type:complete